MSLWVLAVTDVTPTQVERKAWMDHPWSEPFSLARDGNGATSKYIDGFRFSLRYARVQRHHDLGED